MQIKTCNCIILFYITLHYITDILSISNSNRTYILLTHIVHLRSIISFKTLQVKGHQTVWVHS